MTDDRPQTMKDVSHTNPYTGESAGHLFTRGPILAADGGHEDVDADETATETESNDRTEAEDSQTMKDVCHTPPHDATDANRVFERGGKEQVRGDE